MQACRHCCLNSEAEEEIPCYLQMQVYGQNEDLKWMLEWVEERQVSGITVWCDQCKKRSVRSYQCYLLAGGTKCRSHYYTQMCMGAELMLGSGKL